MGRRRTFKGFKAFSFVAGTMLALAGCQPPPAGGDFHPLASGSLENVGAVIEEPGVFRIVGGQSFTTPFSVGCTKLDASANGWQAALAAGAHRVAIYLPGHPRIYGGVLALCTIHKTASGPSSRSYQLVIPESKVQDAQDGLISSVAEQVSVNRQEMPEMTALQMMQQGLTLSQQGAAAALQQTPQPTAITDDYAWMLWFTDRPAILGVNFQPSGVNAPPTPAAVVGSGARGTAAGQGRDVYRRHGAQPPLRSGHRLAGRRASQPRRQRHRGWRGKGRLLVGHHGGRPVRLGVGKEPETQLSESGRRMAASHPPAR
ncbi:MAG: hypothetical protein WDN69_25045 [Aliidongia sp.]